MNRRRLLSIIVTFGVGGGGIFLAFLIDQGIIEVGEEAAVSGTVSRQSRRFQFDVTAGEDIFIEIRETDERGSRGTFTLSDPDGTEVESGRLSPTGTTHETHHATQTGTYALEADPQRSELRVSVSVTDPEA